MPKPIKDEISVGLALEKSYKDTPPYIMSAEQQEVYKFYTERFTAAKNARDQVYEEFDDMNYEDDYRENKRAMVSYLRKKKNDNDVRVNTPTTEKKIEFVANELLSMNLQPEVRAYDHLDRHMEDLGRDFTDIVRRTNEIEQDDDQYMDIILELLSQRAVFVEEVYTTKKVKGRKIARCEKRMLSGLQVFLGDITLPAYRFNDQPYIVKYERMSISRAREIYGDLEAWQFVKPGNFDSAQSNNDFSYRFSLLKKNEVEILHYESAPDDEYNVMINGVMMYELGTKLPWDYEGYNISMTTLKPIHFQFAYGKPLTASAKTLQALDNETLRNLIFKFRQALQPPLGIKSGKIFSKDIWQPGSQTQGIKKDDIEKLIDHQGVTASEMQMYNLIESKTAEFIGQPQRPQSSRKVTATEIKQEQANVIKMLGFSVLAVMRLKRNMTFLRLYNILENYTKPVGRELNNMEGKIESVYRSFSIGDGQIDQDQKGKKVVQMMDRQLTSQEKSAVYQVENQTGVRYSFLNVKKLNEIKTNWFVIIVNKERDSSDLAKAMFTEKLNQGVAIGQVTQRQLNPDTVISEYERTWNAKDMFMEPQPQPTQTTGAPQLGGEPTKPMGSTEIGKQLKQSSATPSLSTMAAGGAASVNP